MFVVSILSGKAQEVFLAERQVVQLVFENDASMQQAVFDDDVTGSPLFFGERNLCQVVCPLVWVVGSAVVGNGSLRARAFWGL